MKTYIQKHLGLGKFFSRFLQVSGLVFNRQSLEEFRKNDELFNYRQPFDIPDLEELGAQVNHMNIVDNAMGFVLKCRAQLRQEENTQRLCRIALRSFESALYSNPKHVFSLQHYAGTLAVMGRYRQASDYYKYVGNVSPGWGAFTDVLFLDWPCKWTIRMPILCLIIVAFCWTWAITQKHFRSLNA